MTKTSPSKNSSGIQDFFRDPWIEWQKRNSLKLFYLESSAYTNKRYLPTSILVPPNTHDLILISQVPIAKIESLHCASSWIAREVLSAARRGQIGWITGVLCDLVVFKPTKLVLECYDNDATWLTRIWKDLTFVIGPNWNVNSLQSVFASTKTERKEGKRQFPFVFCQSILSSN